VKTTIELPDALFRRAKAAAAEEGKSLKDFFSEALLDRLRGRSAGGLAKPWEAGFGGLKSLRRENSRISQLIEAEFGTIDEEEWR